MILDVDLRGRPVLVVGGGAVAERKVGALLAAGARVKVISPGLTPGLEYWLELGQIEVLRRPFAPGDTAGAVLVVAATGHREVDAAVAAEMAAEGRLLCVAAAPELGNVHFTAEVSRGPIRVAVSTGGAAPALARRLRRDLAGWLRPEWVLLAQILAEVRAELQAILGLTQRERAALLEQLVDGPALERLARGEVAAARALVREQIRTRYPGPLQSPPDSGA